MSDLFVGMWVDVEGEVRIGTRNSEGGRGIIIEKNERRISVKYLLSNSCSPDVNSTQIRPANLVLNGRRKSGDGSSTPSLLSHLYGEYRSQQLSQVQHQSESSVVELFPVVLNTSLLLSMLMEKNNSVNVVKSIKENNQTEGKGWLRKIEANLKNIELQQKEKTYLNEYEKELVLKLLLPLKPLYNRASSIVAYAWDVDPSIINRMIITAKKSTTFTIKRKKALRCRKYIIKQQ